MRDNGAFNYSRLINRGVSAARGEVLALLNNDMEANEPGWLREMVSHAMRVGIGAVGARLWYPDGTLQHGGVILGLGGVAGHAFPRIPRGHPGFFNRAWLQQDCSAVTGACLVVRRDVFEKAGGLDEVNIGISAAQVGRRVDARSLLQSESKSQLARIRASCPAARIEYLRSKIFESFC